MKNIKALPISIATIILIAFLSISFLLYDASEAVAIQGVSGSYAQTFAKENKLEFKEIYDSENNKVEIPTTEEDETPADDKTDNTKDNEKPTVKENGEFAYNYDNNTVTIVQYKGVSSIVEIPETIDNLPVKAVDMEVLGKGIDTVVIPESVTSINGDYSSSRYTPTFFTSIIIMALGYIFAFVSTMMGFKKQQNAEGTFYGVPFVYSGLATYILITVLSAVSIFIGATPLLQIIIAVVVFACAIGKLLKKSTARDLIESKDKEIKQKAFFIKALTLDAQTLVSRAQSDEAKELAKKIYEAVRYSDPMSNDALAGAESSITIKFKEFEDAIINDDTELAAESSKELLILINDRNQKCRLLK